ncbi:MAG: hypothetical protein AAGK57_05355, partial [Pseudomonadota bacterium]
AEFRVRGKAPGLGLLEHVLDHMNYQMEALQDMFQKAEAGRLAADTKLSTLSEAVTAMAHRIESGPSQAATMGDPETLAALSRVAEGQENLMEVLAEAAGGGVGLSGSGDGIDSESRMRLRSIDVQLLKVFEEMQQGRQATLDDLRGDLGALTRSIRQLNRMVAAQTDQNGDG